MQIRHGYDSGAQFLLSTSNQIIKGGDSHQPSKTYQRSSQGVQDGG